RTLRPLVEPLLERPGAREAPRHPQADQGGGVAPVFAIHWSAAFLGTQILIPREETSMIYEVRTYTLRAGATPEFEERYEKRLPSRLKHSPLGAFWHTEFGPLNQV